MSTLCFSGHRSYSPVSSDKNRLAEALNTAYGDGYRTFISGMAPGFDLAAAEAVVLLRQSHLDVYLICAIPFACQSNRYTSEDKARYEALLAAADEVIVLSDHYFYGCYYRRDEWMVERSSRIICWYDYSSSGGTRYTVKKALATGLEIVNLYNEDGSLF